MRSYRLWVIFFGRRWGLEFGQNQAKTVDKKAIFSTPGMDARKVYGFWPVCRRRERFQIRARARKKRIHTHCAWLAHFFIAKHNISVKYATSPANGRYNLGYAPRALAMSAFHGFALNINPFSPYLFHIYFYS